MSNVDEGGDLDACMHALCSAWETCCNSLCPLSNEERGRLWLVVLVEEGMKKDCWHNVASHWDWARCDDFLGSRPVQLQVTV